MCPLRPGLLPRSDYSCSWNRAPFLSCQLTPSQPAEVDLTPHISPAYAKLQLARVAKAREMSIAELDAVVAAHTAGRTLGFLGEPTVNVLALNLDLDSRYPYRA